MVTNSTRSLGNASKRLPSMPSPPWESWPETPGNADHAIRWIETYCKAPKGYGHGRPMKLAPFQKQWIRRILAPSINSAVMSCPRGQGKSTLLAALGLWAVFCPGEGGAPQVPVVATTVMQAHRSVYGVALAMVRAERELEGRCLIYSAIGAMKLVVPSTGGEMFPVSSDPDGLQGLDPSLAICDEVGFQGVESWDSLLLAGGKRPRSLVVGIGTPGLDKDNALWHLRSRVLEGRVLPGFDFTEYAADEGCAVEDEAQWRKANPALRAKYQNINALRTALALSPEAHFRIFRLGQWIDGVECWLGDDGRKLWDSLRDPYDLETGAPTWVGVDVGIKRDSTAVAVGQRRPDGRLHVKVKIWLPAKDQAVDVTDVMHHIRELDRTYALEAVSFDARFFDVPAKTLEDEGLPMIEVPQSVEMMSPAVGSTFQLIRAGGLTHDGDPTVAAQVLNAVARYNERGFTLAKAKSKGRIDAAVAICLMVHQAERVERKALQVVIW